MTPDELASLMSHLRAEVWYPKLSQLEASISANISRARAELAAAKTAKETT